MSSLNSHIFGADGSLIQIEFFPSYNGCSGFAFSGNSYSTIWVWIFSNLGFTNTLSIFDSFAFSVLWDSISNCHSPENPNVNSPWNSVGMLLFSLVICIGTSIGDMFFDGFAIFTLSWFESYIGLLSKSLTLTKIVFTPLENGDIWISNFALSVNSIVLNPYTISCAFTFWNSPSGKVPFVNSATTPNSITPNAASTLSDLLSFLWTLIFPDWKFFSAVLCTLNWKNPPKPIIMPAIAIFNIINCP